VLYDQYFIDELKDRADLVRLIEPYAPLKKKGANWMACCPFHQEKTPSFSVNPSKGFYKCFGCGKGGNAFTFLMEMEGLNFPEAVQRVAELNGVPLPQPIDDRQYEQSKKRKEEKKQLADAIIDLNKIALEFWEAQLSGKSKKARAARQYLKTRGISEEVQKEFHIGFAPDSWDALLNHLTEKGADEKIIEQSGLVALNEERNSLYDRFRGRIMFPVLDVNGNPVAFGARAMGDEQPKYLNSPETPAYVKGRHLYGLFQSKAAIRQKKFAILVEGYLDLIALYQFGITNVVASLGTALTPEQAKLLSRSTKQVVINYDGDEAGMKAARKAIDHFIPHDFEVKVLVLPDGKDPDDFIRASGAEAYNAARGHALPFLEFGIAAALKGRNLANAKQKAAAIEDVLPLVKAIRNPIQKRASFDQTMNALMVDDPGLRRDLWNETRARADAAEGETKPRRSTRVKVTVAEQQLLELMIHDAELRAKVVTLLEPADYEMLATSAIFQRLIDQREGDVTLDALEQAAGDDQALRDLAGLLWIAEPLRAEGEVLDGVMHRAENCILTLRSMAIVNRIREVAQETIYAQQAGDQQLVEKLTFEHLDLERIHRHLLSRIAEN
jgi:DNA primase